MPPKTLAEPMALPTPVNVQDRLASYADLADKPNRSIHGHSTRQMHSDAQLAAATIELQRQEIERLAALVVPPKRVFMLSAVMVDDGTTADGNEPKPVRNFMGIWSVSEKEAEDALLRFQAAAIQANPGYQLATGIVNYREVTTQELVAIGIQVRT